MNTNALKSYAPAARRAFIAAVTDQLTRYGLTASGHAPATLSGDVMLIQGQAFPAALAPTRQALLQRLEAEGFAPCVEAIAYTWFNRFAALRYMELHGFLDHGYRVLSHPDGHKRPQILDHVADLDLPGLDRSLAMKLKMAGDQDEDLYRLILLAQCDALHQAMPFLFDRLGAETALAMPANLLHTDSVIRQMVEKIDEEAWQQIEVVGWLYQFYIAEKKDAVIGKVVASEDIPAATQLFTPNWIVKYLVQNSLGAGWLATYPESPIKGEMAYYIAPAEQTPEVQARVAASIPGQLDPESLTFLDPACGSGHILVEAYDVFKQIYLERGHRQRDIPQLILEKNLFGLDIDPRAAQLTGFALMMKARADDRRLFDRGLRLNVMALVDSHDIDAARLLKAIKAGDGSVSPDDITTLKRLFEHATTFGALIQVSEALARNLPALERFTIAQSVDLFESDDRRRLGVLVRQAQFLAMKYDFVVANPPYIGSKFHIPILKSFLKQHYAGYEKDVFSAFIARNLVFSKPRGRLGFMCPFVWMFISSYEDLRIRIIDKETITSLIQLEYSGFDGATVPICTFTLQEGHVAGEKGCYIRLSDFRGSENQAPRTLEAVRDRRCGWFYEVAQDQFRKIPGSPVAYWVSPRIRRVFQECEELGTRTAVRQGLATADNGRFMRAWPEVALARSGYGYPSRELAAGSGKKWFPYNKGGEFRKWYGNNEYVINWEADGRDLNAFKPRAVIRNPDYFFLPSVTWSFVSSAFFGVRYSGPGAIFDVGGSSAFPDEADSLWLTGFLCSNQVFGFMKILNPTLNFQVGNVASLPVLRNEVAKRKLEIEVVVSTAISFSKTDWDAYERSWDFQRLPLLDVPGDTLAARYEAWIQQNQATIAEMKGLEEENNRLFIEAYGLQDELSPEVPIEQITLTVNPSYRYGGKMDEAQRWERFRSDTIEELISYAVGNMLGRYSLDVPGLAYADAGGEGFDPGKYVTFPADADGIVPMTEAAWFPDDAGERLVAFIAAAFGAAQLETNLAFMAQALSPKKGENARETLRRYLVDTFYKSHLQCYKKRPIYWLFSSGKQKAFQALVYLHRYQPGTLARMRHDYVIPLQGKLLARIDQLDRDITAATSTAHRKTLEKERDRLHKQSLELRDFEEKLRHQADQRIALDLDDGVKVNYGKFGDLLAEVKTVTGGSDDD